MSVIARTTLLRPHWLAAAFGLAVGWLLYRPLDDRDLVPSLRAEQHRMQLICDDGPCAGTGPEDPYDPTRPIAATAVELKTIHGDCGLSSTDDVQASALGTADEISIYANSSGTADPFVGAETAAVAPESIVQTAYAAPLDVTPEPDIPRASCASSQSTREPTRLPPPANQVSGHDAAALDEHGRERPKILPRTCALTDRRTGMPVATLTIAAEIRSGILDIDAYQHRSGSAQVTEGNQDLADPHAPEEGSTLLADERSMAEFASYESMSATMDADISEEPKAVPANDPTWAIAQIVEQSRAWIESGHAEEAVDVLANALFDYPQDISLLQHIAIAYLAKEDTASALSAAEQCLAIDRGNADSNEIMSEVLRTMGQANRARHYADHALFLRRNANIAGQDR